MTIFIRLVGKNIFNHFSRYICILSILEHGTVNVGNGSASSKSCSFRVKSSDILYYWIYSRPMSLLFEALNRFWLMLSSVCLTLMLNTLSWAWIRSVSSFETFLWKFSLSNVDHDAETQNLAASIPGKAIQYFI